MQLVMEGTRRLPRRLPGPGRGGGGRPPSQRAIQQVSQQGGFPAGGENHPPPRAYSPSGSGFYPRQPPASSGPSTTSTSQHSFSFPQPTYSKWKPEKVEGNSFVPSHPAPAQEDSYGSPLAPLISAQEPAASILSEEQFGFDGSSSLWDSSPPNSLPIVFPPSSSSTSLSSTSPSSSSSFPSITSTFSSTSLPSPPSPTANLEFSVEEENAQNVVSSSLEVDLTGVVGKDDLSESSNLQLGLPAQSAASQASSSNRDPEIALAIKIVSPFVSPSEDTAEEAGVPQQPSDPFPDQENPGK